MSILPYIIQSFIIGIIIAAPVGPIGILCIRKTMERGIRGTISVGLGAALADSLYGFMAVAGVNVISGFILKETVILRILGGIFLLWLGIKELKSKADVMDKVSLPHKSYLKLSIQTFLLTLTNPLTILSFAAIFATMSLGNLTINKVLLMVSAVFIGSMTWWIILGKITLTTKKFLSENLSHKIYLISGCMLIGFALWAWVSIFFF